MDIQVKYYNVDRIGGVDERHAFGVDERHASLTHLSTIYSASAQRLIRDSGGDPGRCAIGECEALEL